jgi:four helix bundle protein
VDYKDLDAWKQAMRLVEDVYRLTRTFPTEELYGLTSQVRRAAVSIPSNLAEGSARRSPREYGHFLTIALGSLAELEYAASGSANDWATV